MVYTKKRHKQKFGLFKKRKKEKVVLASTHLLFDTNASTSSFLVVTQS